MSEIVPELKLTFLEGSNPKHYALNVKIDLQQTHPHLIIGHNSGAMVNPNTQYLISVELGESSQGSDNVDIDMGQISFDNENSQIEVKLIQGNSMVGSGNIRVKEAQQESRPIEKDF